MQPGLLTQFELNDKTPDGTPYIAMKWLTQALGLDWAGQHGRITGDPVLSGYVRRCRALLDSGGYRDVIALPRNVIPLWLVTLDVSRIVEDAPGHRERLLGYQREAAAALVGNAARISLVYEDTIQQVLDRLEQHQPPNPFRRLLWWLRRR
jgi:hypothetical protein